MENEENNQPEQQNNDKQNFPQQSNTQPNDKAAAVLKGVGIALLIIVGVPLLIFGTCVLVLIATN